MKTYQSHKIVKAAQLIGVHYPNQGDSATAYEFDDGVEIASTEFHTLHRPDYTAAVGDYLVQYEDGYRSISPRATFEAGYKVVEPGSVVTMSVEPCDAMSFSTALKMAMEGHHIANMDWQGDEEHVVYLEGGEDDDQDGHTVVVEPFLSLCTLGARYVPYTPTQREVLSSEWYVKGGLGKDADEQDPEEVAA